MEAEGRNLFKMKNANFGLLSSLRMKKLRMAASLRHVSLASGHGFFYVLILESEMGEKKTGAKVWVREFLRA